MLSTVQAKLLIVDDLPENLLALEALIKREDRQVFKALSADEALSLLLEHEFAMAILDVQMPGMNGFELAELMRGTEKTKNIPIVFVSAAGRELNYAFKGYESGAVDFLHKPLDIHAAKSPQQPGRPVPGARRRLAGTQWRHAALADRANGSSGTRGHRKQQRGDAEIRKFHETITGGRQRTGGAVRQEGADRSRAHGRPHGQWPRRHVPGRQRTV